MKYRIDQIADGGRVHREPLPQADFDALLVGEGTGLRADGPVTFDVRLTKAGRRILVEGTLSATLHGQCRWCLETTRARPSGAFTLTLRPEAERVLPGVEGKDRLEVGEGESAGSFSLDEADEDYYSGEEIDLWPLLREQILLSLPDYLSCRDGCKGLCPVCGTNLNQRECGCERTVPDPRLAKLKDFKLA
ncbi:MAG: DUF177 domain-containing protein [Deltaproteobacteria bacterium]|nr:MAG: DUF177 domain-containing protein [Deltaproteobacteria bacterium]